MYISIIIFFVIYNPLNVSHRITGRISNENEKFSSRQSNTQLKLTLFKRLRSLQIQISIIKSKSHLNAVPVANTKLVACLNNGLKASDNDLKTSIVIFRHGLYHITKVVT